MNKNEIEYFDLKEICEICGVDENFVVEMVNYGILQPRGRSKKTWQFSAEELLRFQKALRLHNDLELDFAGIALTLDLLEQIDMLHFQMRQMQQLMRLFKL